MAVATGVRGIQRLKLDDIVAEVRRKQKWSARQAQEAELWYRRFLEMSFIHGRRPVYGISEKSDFIWHDHILSTKRYQRDTQRIFGHYLNHTPGKPPARTRDSAMDRATQWYTKAYGGPPIDISICCY